MTTTDRDRATITALKIALEQAADRLVREVGKHGSWAATLGDLPADVTRWRAMAAPDWEALPVEVTGGGGEA
jgi:hypothetical protein